MPSGSEGRLVVYNGVTLPFTTMGLSSQVDVSGRQHLRTTFTLTFTGFVVNDDISNSYSMYVKMRYNLLAAHKELSITDLGGAGKNWLRVLPTMGYEYAQPPTPGEHPDRLHDVAGGPYPQSFEITSIWGNSFRYVYRIQVTVPGADVSEITIGQSPILGMDVAVSYGIDENHMTSRNVEGTIHLARQQGGAGRWAWPPTDPDDKHLRGRLTQSGFEGMLLQRIYAIPKGMKRVSKAWTFNAGMTEANFTFFDVEVYRALPWEMTRGDALYRVAYQGVTYGVPMRTTLRGFFEAPKNVAKERVMQRIIELAIIVMGLEDDVGRFIDTFEYETSLFRNRIDFQMAGLLNFGKIEGLDRNRAFNAERYLAQFGLGRILGMRLDRDLCHDNESLPPGLFGTAGLAGHPYDPHVVSAQEALQTDYTVNSYLRAPYYGTITRSASGRLPERYNEVISKRVVSLQPGEMRCIVNHNETIVLYTADPEVNNKPSETVITAGPAGMFFVGFRNILYQRHRHSLTRFTEKIYTQAAVNALKAGGWGYLSFKYGKAEPRFVPLALGRGGNVPNGTQLTRVHAFWRFRLNAKSLRKARQKFRGDLAAMENEITLKMRDEDWTDFEDLPRLLGWLCGG